ncbi:hypothetical protein AGMMS49975_09620 [Clostridia bacterium]|nr:hypothetical protein AGMMS49975_09620 [Clostridia bacterium]
MSISKKNLEGYMDMTAFHALSNISKSEKKECERKPKITNQADETREVSQCEN